MHHLIWLLILAPPVVAYVFWMAVGQKTGASSKIPAGAYAAVHLGKYGYWIILAICYASFFGIALAMHKI